MIAGIGVIEEDAGEGDGVAAVLDEVEESRLIEDTQIVRGEENGALLAIAVEAGPGGIGEEGVFEDGGGPDVLVAVEEDEAIPRLLGCAGEGGDYDGGEEGVIGGG